MAPAAARALGAWLEKTPRAKVASTLGTVLPVARASIEVKDAARPQRMILLPSGGRLRSNTPDTANFLSTMADHGPSVAVKAVGGPPVKMKVVDSIHEDGAKLIEASPEELQKLRIAQPGLRVVPECFYDLAVSVQRIEGAPRPAAGGVSTMQTLTIEVVSRSGGAPVAGATVVAFTDFAAREGAQGVSSSKGKVALKLPSSTTKLERVYVYPEGMLWGVLRRNLALSSNNLRLLLDPIDLAAPDSLRYFAHAGQLQDGEGVKVGVLDTGIALQHPDLEVAGGECTVPGEQPDDYGPRGGDHGTHCAGIIAARGQAPTGVRGVAPAAVLYSLRVFPTVTPANPKPRASNFSIAKAIDRAVAFGCDVLNLSLGGGPSDPATEAAIEDAHRAGVIVIAAAGNDDRKPVSFPAAFDLAVAVSAVGRKGLFPSGSVFHGDVATPYGSDKKNFIAAFSNVGPDIDCTGPGVAVISTVPPDTYTAMSGTSMATPAVTGLAARLFAGQPALLMATRNAARANSMIKALLSSAKDLGFGPMFQGKGLPS